MPEKFVWNLQYSVHLEEIDAQHKRFFELINAIYGLLAGKNIDPESLLIVVTHLGDYAYYHFATEEGYFKIFHYRDEDAHVKEHNVFRANMKKFLEQARQLNGKDLHAFATEIADFAKEWMEHHILIEDKKYMPLFKAKGVR
ncbi:MAG: bacteriohemerythrin [Candidatus Peribacteraceae bacterium]|nr:bacteriohemerythrin [Candidatus Peribacteraceae bacterium]MDD5741857.1 bacteriohemerythrin [Candidatus Peribacteraceae bacterium]